MIGTANGRPVLEFYIKQSRSRNRVVVLTHQATKADGIDSSELISGLFKVLKVLSLEALNILFPFPPVVSLPFSARVGSYSIRQKPDCTYKVHTSTTLHKVLTLIYSALYIYAHL
jgi:hypothetical protein